MSQPALLSAVFDVRAAGTGVGPGGSDPGTYLEPIPVGEAPPAAGPSEAGTALLVVAWLAMRPPLALSALPLDQHPATLPTRIGSYYACTPRGIALSRVLVYGCTGLRYSSSELAISTTWPLCITITWSAMYFTTDKSCEMKM